MSSKNITTKLTIQNLAAELKATFAKKAELPTKVSDLTNDSNFQTGSQVEAAIASQIGRVYRPGPSVAFANLPALTAENLGKVVNVTNDFTTTSSFVEGAGKKYKAGADVGIVEVSAAGYVATEDETAQAGKTYYADANGTALDTQPAEGADISEAGYYEHVDAVYKYNVFANFVDTSNLLNKLVGGTTGALVKQTADGDIEDAGILAADLVTKVSGGTTGNLAALDSNGKITDSGKKAADFALRDTNAVSGNIAKFDSNGDPVDSGIAYGDVVTKVANPTSGNLAALDSNGKITDSGKKASDFVERVFNDNVEDVVLHESDISDYTAEEIAALLADSE